MKHRRTSCLSGIWPALVLLALLRICGSACGEGNSATVTTDNRQNAVNPPSPPLPQAASSSNGLTRLMHPISWMTWGFELRVREEYRNNASTLSSQSPGHEFNYQRYRARLSTTFSPWPSLDFNARLAWEGRTYQKPASLRGVDWDEGLFDEFNLTLRNPVDRPLQLTVGRQAITFGNRWLIWDGTSADGSRTEFFDAARLTYQWEQQQTTVDLIYLDQSAKADRWLPAINDNDRLLSEQDERGAIVYLSTKSLPKTQLDGYFIFKHDAKVSSAGNNADFFVFGARAEGDLTDHWKYRAEFAPELGRKNGRDLRAFGAHSRLSYFFLDGWNNNLRLGYEYLSGDDPDTGGNEGWDPLWGRRGQFSELLIFTFATEDRNRLAEWSNYQRLDVGWSCHPTKRMALQLDYMPLFANANPLRGTPGYSNDGRFRGQLATSVVRYIFTAHWNGYLLYELFFPGNYYTADHRDLAQFFRAELVFRY